MSGLSADVLIKATNVDGIHDRDPKLDKDAKKYDYITYLDVLNKKIKVMDFTAVTLCMENDIPILVMNINKKNNLKKDSNGKQIGTIVD